jgi:phage gp36-like protein
MYATTAAMISRFGTKDLMLLTEREDSTPGEINLSVLEQALADATAEIDSYLAGRYPLPLAAVPDVLERNCCDIARYLLLGDRAPEQVEKRYQAVVKWLTLVSKGDIQLGLSAGEPVSQSGTIAEIQSAGSVFSRASSKGFI